MDKKNRDIVNIIVSVMVFVLGLVIVIAPAQIFSLLIFVLGTAAIVFGLYDLLKVRPLVQDKQYRLTVMIRGLVSVLIGLLAIILRAKLGESVVAVMKTVIGIYLIICAVADFYIWFKFKKIADEVDIPLPKKAALIKALVSLAVAILLFVMDSNEIIAIIMRLMGGIFMIAGIGFLIYSFKNKTIVVEPESVKDEVNEETSSDEE